MFQKQNDHTNASKAYTQALEEKPDDRRLLTKLMQLYSEERDWATPRSTGAIRWCSLPDSRSRHA